MGIHKKEIDTTSNREGPGVKYSDNESLVRKLSEIGIALSAEKNLEHLLEAIISYARLFSGADAGTLYIMNEENHCLEFTIIQNDTLKTRMGGTAGPITWPPVPLQKEDGPNFSNVSSYVAITGKTVNIPDVYAADGFDFSGTRKYDSVTGYRSESMLVIPMKNKEDEIIGVLQLINAIDPATHRAVPFLKDHIDLIASLSSQAAVAISNVKLYRDMENLFDSFIRTIALAIDEKSHYTAGHIERVQKLAMSIAVCMSKKTEGPFKDFSMNKEELKELSIASWLHDIGKIVTPEHVADKSTKLEKIFDMAHMITLKYEVFKRDARIRALEDKLKVYKAAGAHVKEFEEIDGRCEQECNSLVEEEKFVLNCNQPGEFMDDAKIDRLKKIASNNWNCNGRDVPYLTEDEVSNLSIRQGSLTAEERKVIENHALVTFKMLESLPLPKKLKNVPVYAAAHHEKLDGTGYPFGLKAEGLPIPSRIIAIADIFEALTASDRPYRKPMHVSQALNILGSMKEDGKIDGDILELFMQEKIYLEYAQGELDSWQVDC